MSQLNLCYCGCGGTTKKKFVPGHDARFHGWAKKVARGQIEANPLLAAMPHDDARTEFVEYADAVFARENPEPVAAPAAPEGQEQPTDGQTVAA